MLNKYKARGFHIWHVYIEDYSRGGGRVPSSFCSSQASKYGIQFPILADPGASQVRSFMSGGIPLNIIFTVKDMKIVYKRSGFSSSAIDSTIRRHLP